MLYTRVSMELSNSWVSWMLLVQDIITQHLGSSPWTNPNKSLKVPIGVKRCLNCWDVLGVNLPGKFLESSRGWLYQFAAKIFPGVLRCCLMVILWGKPRVFHINCCKFSKPSQYYLFFVKGFQQMLCYVVYVVSGTLQSEPLLPFLITPLTYRGL